MLGGVLGIALFLGLIALVVVGIVAFARRYSLAAAPSRKGDEALDAARLRLAKGEITVDEYEALVSSLRK